MSTQEQTNANRKNAESSTGPKTPEGKAVVSQNAVKHGFFAKNDVISGEDLAAYEQHRADIYDEFAPLTPTESVLTQRIASLTWRLMRADRLQTTTINTLVAAQHKATHQPGIPKFNIAGMIESLRIKDADPDYPLTDAEIILSGLGNFKNKPVITDPAVDEAMHAAANPPDSTRISEAEIQLGTVIYNDFHGSAVIERLQGYEQKIETSLFKTIRQIQQIQERRIKQDAARDRRDVQYLRAEDEANRNRREAEFWEKMQNEPNSDAPPEEHVHSGMGASLLRSAAEQRDDSPEPQKTRNKPNSELTSITEMTYNRSRYAKAKLAEGQSRFIGDPNQANLANPDDHPGRSANKQT